MKNDLVSIIIPTLNEAENISNCLKSIKKQNYKNLEIIVIDNHSTDKTTTIVRKFTQTVYKRGPERSSQRNYGASKAKGKYLMFLDADMEITQNLISEAVIKTQNGKFIIAFPEDSKGQTFWGKAIAFERGFYKNEKVISAARFYPKELFFKLGGFNKELVAGEDWDLSQRAQKAGYRLQFTQNSLIHHETVQSLQEIIAKKAYYLDNISKYAKKHPQRFKKQSSPRYRSSIFLKNWPRFISKPHLALGFVTLKTIIWLNWKMHPQKIRDGLKKDLAKLYWNTNPYINSSIQFSKDTQNYSWMKFIKEKSKTSKAILDVGCAEGSRLNQLYKKASRFGLDYSAKAIKVGTKKYKDLKLLNADAEKMPFANNYFDLVFTAYTIEHLQNPEKVIDEMIRVAKKGGIIVFVGPNYGSPLIPTPLLKGPRFIKIFRVFLLEIRYLLYPNNKNLGWKQIEPKISKNFISDDDSVNQPYLNSLIRYVRKKDLTVNLALSGWLEAQIASKYKEILFSLLRISKILNFYPFKYWGPTIFLVCKK